MGRRQPPGEFRSGFARQDDHGHFGRASPTARWCNPDRNNWAPRLGLAYTLTPKTVIRSGYGISYIHFNRAGGENLLAYNPPSVITININNPNPQTSPTCAADVANSNCFRPTALGYTASILDPTRIDYTNVSLRYTPPNTRTGYVQSWHFTVQQQLAKDLLFEVGYVGNHGVKLMTLGDVNQARPQAPNENSTLNARRPYLGFGDVEISYGAGYDTTTRCRPSSRRGFRAASTS